MWLKEVDKLLLLCAHVLTYLLAKKKAKEKRGLKKPSSIRRLPVIDSFGLTYILKAFFMWQHAWLGHDNAPNRATVFLVQKKCWPLPW